MNQLRELPNITASSYATTAYDPTALHALQVFPDAKWAEDENRVLDQSVQHFLNADARKGAADRRINAAATALRQAPDFGYIRPQQGNQIMAARLVRVIIADTNENLPLQDRLLYKGEEQFTDLTDQELFFEIDVAGILKAHNEKRTKTVDKSKAALQGMDRGSVMLEPARIRDLKMVVVNVATFA